MKNQKKAIVLGLTASMLMPVCFNGGTAEAAAADMDVAAMQAEINDLTARLTDLENSLAAAKEKQEAAKSEKKAKKEAPTLKWSGSTKSGYMYDETKPERSRQRLRSWRRRWWTRRTMSALDSNSNRLRLNQMMESTLRKRTRSNWSRHMSVVPLALSM